jgi:putative Mg2+ transporter-C (MgtC) family protein
LRGAVRLQIVYDNGQGVLREILRVCGQRNWQLTDLEADDGNIDRDQVAVAMTLSGTRSATPHKCSARSTASPPC